MNVKKWIAAAVSCMMLAGVMSITAAAQEQTVLESTSATEVSSFGDFKAALEAGTSVKLTADFAMDEIVELSGKNVEIDLNGKVISSSKYIKLTDKSAMKLTDSSADGAGRIDFVVGSKNNGNMYAEDYTELTWIYVKDSEFTMDKGTLTTSDEIWGYFNSIIWADNSEVVINGGTLEMKRSGAYGTAVYLKTSTVTFNGGIIAGGETKTGNSSSDPGVSIPFAATDSESAININGGKIEAMMILADGGAEINITDGEIKLASLGANGGSVVNISGGSVSQSNIWADMLEGAEGVIALDSGAVLNVSENAQITGGIDVSNATVNITGGKVAGDVIAQNSVVNIAEDTLTGETSLKGNSTVNDKTIDVNTVVEKATGDEDGSEATGFFTAVTADGATLTSIEWSAYNVGVTKTARATFNPMTVNGSASFVLIIDNLANAIANTTVGVANN